MCPDLSVKSIDWQKLRMKCVVFFRNGMIFRVLFHVAKKILQVLFW